MTSCLIRGVRSIELVTGNLEEASRFYETVWGLTPVEARNNSRYFRGAGRYHHVLGLHCGAQPAVARVVFDVADRSAIDRLHRDVTASGGQPSAPAQLSTAGGGYGFACKDPDGRSLAFVCDCADHSDGGDQADQPRKIAHVNLNARDFDASLGFFTNALGFRLID